MISLQKITIKNEFMAIIIQWNVQKLIYKFDYIIRENFITNEFIAKLKSMKCAKKYWSKFE